MVAWRDLTAPTSPDFQPGNTPELKSVEIHNLFVDHEGTLWVNNVEGGLISCRDGKFHFEHDDPDIPGSWLVGILNDNPARLEFVSRSGLIFRRMDSNGSNYWQTFSPPGNLTLNAVCQDGLGIDWCLTTNNTLAQIQQDHLVSISTPPGLKSHNINILVKDAFGRIWAGTKKEIAMWDGKTFVNMTPTNGEPFFNVGQMFPCKDGSFWVLGGNRLRKCSGQCWRAEARLLDDDNLNETNRADFFGVLPVCTLILWAESGFPIPKKELVMFTRTARSHGCMNRGTYLPAESVVGTKITRAICGSVFAGAGWRVCGPAFFIWSGRRQALEANPPVQYVKMKME